jgi:hypothetical protein
MSLAKLIGVFVCSGILLACGVDGANSQACPYRNGIPATANCLRNPNPTPIPGGMGGVLMTPANCVRVRPHAIASLYSYDDGACHPVRSRLVASPQNLVLLKDANDFLPPNYKKMVTQTSNFHGYLYCDDLSNTLILAFRGSVSLTPFDRNAIDDWFNTNLVQHLRIKSPQYQYAEDVAYEVKTQWSLGAFDGMCGSGHPDFMLAGHSKGGGQAQSAAVVNSLRAAVFNSDLVSPKTFTEWLQAPWASLIVDWLTVTRRPIRQILGCEANQIDPYLAPYFAKGNVTDVRMVNDPLTKSLFLLCGNNLPHANIEWLANTTSCSADGHAIETVFRELQACTGP